MRLVIIFIIIGYGMAWLFWGIEVFLFGKGVGWDRIVVGDGDGE